MPVADDFFILVRDESGRLRLQDRTARLGVGTALLAELVLSGHVEVCNGRLWLRRNGWPLRDSATLAVAEYLYADRQLSDLRSWLLVVAQFAEEQVGDRLARAGQMRRNEIRRLLRDSVVRWLPVNMNITALPVARLRWKAGKVAPVEMPDRVLLALLHITELRAAVLDGLDPSANRYIDALIASLPPPLYELVRCLGEQLAANAMTYR